MTVTAHLLQSTACVGIAAILAFALRRAPARTRGSRTLPASSAATTLTLVEAKGEVKTYIQR